MKLLLREPNYLLSCMYLSLYSYILFAYSCINRNTSHISAETCILADKDDSGATDRTDKNAPQLRLGLKPNINQFLLLVLVNAFVGAMIGLEQTVVPLLGKEEFGLESNVLVLSFIASFGVVKAVLNLFAGNLSDRWNRKKVLVLGWLFGIPVPFILLFAPSWNWILVANVLLGVNQGLAWSMTVNMKIDLALSIQYGFLRGLISRYENVPIINTNPAKVRMKDKGGNPINTAHAEAAKMIIEGVIGFAR
jgi:nitrate/nitrite transporter NarK